MQHVLPNFVIAENTSYSLWIHLHVEIVTTWNCPCRRRTPATKGPSPSVFANCQRWSVCGKWWLMVVVYHGFHLNGRWWSARSVRAPRAFFRCVSCFRVLLQKSGATCYRYQALLAVQWRHWLIKHIIVDMQVFKQLLSSYRDLINRCLTRAVICLDKAVLFSRPSKFLQQDIKTMQLSKCMNNNQLITVN